MKRISSLFIAAFMVLINTSCQESESISSQDISALQGMSEQLQLLELYHDSLDMNEGMHGSYYDSMIQYNDSLFWRHHSQYSHGNLFDDHNHQGHNHHGGMNGMNMNNNCPCNQQHNENYNYHTIDHHRNIDAMKQHHDQFHN